MRTTTEENLTNSSSDLDYERGNIDGDYFTPSDFVIDNLNSSSEILRLTFEASDEQTNNNAYDDDDDDDGHETVKMRINKRNVSLLTMFLLVSGTVTLCMISPSSFISKRAPISRPIQKHFGEVDDEVFENSSGIFEFPSSGLNDTDHEVQESDVTEGKRFLNERRWKEKDSVLSFPSGLFFHDYMVKVGRNSRKMSSSAVTTSTRGEGEAQKMEEHHDEEESEIGVEVSYEDVFDTIVFLFCAFLLGHLTETLGMPALVGEILSGFILGPPLLDYVPYPTSLVLFGELGLILLLLEAGVEIDVAQLRQSGMRSAIMATTGSILSLGSGVGLGLAAGMNVRESVAVGASFSPTSLAVASNALVGGDYINTPVGQLIVSACVVDDVIGLIVLGMLEVLVKEEPNVVDYFYPMISGVGFLLVLGWSGLTWIPNVIERRILPMFAEGKRDFVAFSIMMALLFAYMPALHYSKGSYLTGAFLAGLPFCQNHSVHSNFVHQAKRNMRWLLRIFFAATIGFNVPIKLFGRAYVLQWGFTYYLIVLVKLLLGFFVPKSPADQVPTNYPFNPTIRDTLITGTAMTSRGEFSFIIASFALGHGLFDEEQYASIIFAVLLSTVTSPYALLNLIKYYNRKAEHYLAKTTEDLNNKSTEQDQSEVPLYLVIQIRSKLKPGLQVILKQSVNHLGLAIIDHRSWHPRGFDAVVVTEMYVQDKVTKVTMFGAASGDEEEGGQPDSKENVKGHKVILSRCGDIEDALIDAINLEDSKVKVFEWKPNIFLDTSNESSQSSMHDEEDEDGSNHETKKSKKKLLRSFSNLDPKDQETLLEEAKRMLSKNEVIDTGVDDVPVIVPGRKRAKAKSVGFEGSFSEEGKILSEVDDATASTSSGSQRQKQYQQQQQQSGGCTTTTGITQRRKRRTRKKTVSTPVFAGGVNMWDTDSVSREASIQGAISDTHHYERYDLSGGSAYGLTRRKKMPSDLRAIAEENAPTVEERLGGFVRHQVVEGESSSSGGGKVGPWHLSC